MSTNLLKRYCESCGPGEASGWYCTEKSGSFLCVSPSTVLSLRLMCVISAMPMSDFYIDGKAVVLGGYLDLAGR